MQTQHFLSLNMHYADEIALHWQNVYADEMYFIGKTCTLSNDIRREKDTYVNEIEFRQQELLPTWIRRRSCRHRKNALA